MVRDFETPKESDKRASDGDSTVVSLFCEPPSPQDSVHLGELIYKALLLRIFTKTRISSNYMKLIRLPLRGREYAECL